MERIAREGIGLVLEYLPRVLENPAAAAGGRSLSACRICAGRLSAAGGMADNREKGRAGRIAGRGEAPK